MSDNKVVGIHGGFVTRVGEVDTVVVEVLEDLLAKARSGELRSLIATGFVADGSRMTAFAGNTREDVYNMLGSIRWLEHEYVAQVEALLAEDECPPA